MSRSSALVLIFFPAAAFAENPNDPLLKLDRFRPAALVSKQNRVPENAKKAPQRLKVEKDLEPVIAIPHGWTRYTFYFENGALVDSLAGLNHRRICALSGGPGDLELSPGESIEILGVESYDFIEEGCAEWGQNDGWDDICIRGTGAYFPKNVWYFKIKHPRLKKLSCRRVSTKSRPLKEPMKESDRISPEFLKDTFRDLVSLP